MSLTRVSFTFVFVLSGRRLNRLPSLRNGHVMPSSCNASDSMAEIMISNTTLIKCHRICRHQINTKCPTFEAVINRKLHVVLDTI